jgi:hypothetical protein
MPFLSSFAVRRRILGSEIMSSDTTLSDIPVSERRRLSGRSRCLIRVAAKEAALISIKGA